MYPSCQRQLAGGFTFEVQQLLAEDLSRSPVVKALSRRVVVEGDDGVEFVVGQGCEVGLAGQEAAHDLEDVVEGEPERGPELDCDLLLGCIETGLEMMRPVRSVAGRGAALPAPDRGLADTELLGQFGNPRLTGLDIGPDPRSRGGIGMQLGQHKTRSRYQDIPNTTLGRSN